MRLTNIDYITFGIIILLILLGWMIVSSLRDSLRRLSIKRQYAAELKSVKWLLQKKEVATPEEAIALYQAGITTPSDLKGLNLADEATIKKHYPALSKFQLAYWENHPFSEIKPWKWIESISKPSKDPTASEEISTPPSEEEYSSKDLTSALDNLGNDVQEEVNLTIPAPSQPLPLQTPSSEATSLLKKASSVVQTWSSVPKSSPEPPPTTSEPTRLPPSPAPLPAIQTTPSSKLANSSRNPWSWLLDPHDLYLEDSPSSPDKTPKSSFPRPLEKKHRQTDSDQLSPKKQPSPPPASIAPPISWPLPNPDNQLLNFAWHDSEWLFSRRGGHNHKNISLLEIDSAQWQNHLSNTNPLTPQALAQLLSANAEQLDKTHLLLPRETFQNWKINSIATFVDTSHRKKVGVLLNFNSIGEFPPLDNLLSLLGSYHLDGFTYAPASSPSLPESTRTDLLFIPN